MGKKWRKRSLDIVVFIFLPLTNSFELLFLFFSFWWRSFSFNYDQALLNWIEWRTKERKNFSRRSCLYTTKSVFGQKVAYHFWCCCFSFFSFLLDSNSHHRMKWNDIAICFCAIGLIKTIIPCDPLSDDFISWVLFPCSYIQHEAESESSVLTPSPPFPPQYPGW